MLKRRKRPRTKPISVERIPAFLQWLRTRECRVAGYWYHRKIPGGLIQRQHVCSGKVQAAHVRIGTDGGTGLKPSDRYALPLCEGAHLGDQHTAGERQFWEKFGLDPLKEAEKAFEQWQRETAAGQRYRREKSAREEHLTQG